jgi:hypothetical protein
MIRTNKINNLDLFTSQSNKNLKKNIKTQSKKPDGTDKMIKEKFIKSTDLLTVLLTVIKSPLLVIVFTRGFIFFVVRDGIEPPTRGFSVHCSTN